jgi:beta-glucosidase
MASSVHCLMDAPSNPSLRILISGTLATAYNSGLKEDGVGDIIKCFVADDQEFEWTSQDLVTSERALREVNLYPFMVAQRDAEPLAYMTS